MSRAWKKKLLVELEDTVVVLDQKKSDGIARKKQFSKFSRFSFFFSFSNWPQCYISIFFHTPFFLILNFEIPPPRASFIIDSQKEQL